MIPGSHKMIPASHKGQQRPQKANFSFSNDKQWFGIIATWLQPDCNL